MFTWIYKGLRQQKDETEILFSVSNFRRKSENVSLIEIFDKKVVEI